MASTKAKGYIATAFASVTLIAGVSVLSFGLWSDNNRVSTEVKPSADLETAYVVVEPYMLEFVGEGRVNVNGEGELTARTARASDVDAFLEDREYTTIDSLETWETLTISTQAGTTAAEESEEGTDDASPSATPSPSTEASVAASPSPTPSSNTPEATASPNPEMPDEPEIVTDPETSSDHWRSEWKGTNRLSVSADDIKSGEVLVLSSADGSALTSADISITREVDDAWISTTIQYGAVITGLGAIALIAALAFNILTGRKQESEANKND